jgi:UDP-N-acetylglucosamine--N-acetylmuramyl-(pentapeptide) pyrophosphoryl-undecaprenol N-acetylglucosamine transferase
VTDAASAEATTLAASTTTVADAIPATDRLRVVIGVGGTAGHVVPAIAVADVLRDHGAQVVFAGGDRFERQLVPEAGYELRTLKVAPLARRRPAEAARAAAVDFGALGHAMRLIGELSPDVVLGAGGYVAGPVGLAGALRRVPLDGRDSDRYRVTGRPVPVPATDRDAARARFGLQDSEQCVLVFGGSQGARSINQAAIEAFAGARFRILHAAGTRDLDELESPGPYYDLRGYIGDFGQALLAADLVVARSGGSVFEIAAHGRPMILIPYPYAASGHQDDNARYMERAGAAIVISDAELTGPRLALEVGRLLGDRARLNAMARASRGVARPDAAREIAGEVLAAGGAGE